jgi:dihydrolipoamide dehydrogenase
VRTGVTARALAQAGTGWRCELSDGAPVEAEQVLVCAGRRPDVKALAADKAGLREEKGRLAVNEFLQTSVPSIYAVGDVNGLSLLAHAAAVQGETAADHALGEARAYPHHLVPRCLYTWPEVASVGEWAHGAEARGVAVKTQRFFFQGSPKAMAGNETDGFIQIVSEKGGEGLLLGAQIIGPHATELIHIFAVALQGGLTVDRLRGVIYAHPTLAEGVKEALAR